MIRNKKYLLLPAAKLQLTDRGRNIRMGIKDREDLMSKQRNG